MKYIVKWKINIAQEEMKGNIQKRKYPQMTLIPTKSGFQMISNANCKGRNVNLDLCNPH